MRFLASVFIYSFLKMDLVSLEGDGHVMGLLRTELQPLASSAKVLANAIHELDFLQAVDHYKYFYKKVFLDRAVAR